MLTSRMNKSTYGENLCETYLTSQGTALETGLKLPRVSQLINFVSEYTTPSIVSGG